MKIEKISDNQIRCKLTPEDLEERQIRLSELAYGSEKARALFRDMMLQAHKEYGFTNDSNIPLMIEAIPGSGNSLTLIITKVEDPEELDTRFAKFSPTEVVADGEAKLEVDGADDIIDIFHKLLEAKAASIRKKAEGTEDKQAANGADNNAVPQPVPKGADGAAPQPASKKAGRIGGRKKEFPQGTVSLTRAFRFRQLDDVIHAAEALNSFYQGESSLYRISRAGSYLLVVHQCQSPEDFNRVCNTLSEYGAGENCSAAAEAHLREHEETVIKGNAVPKLASLLSKS